MSAGEDRPTLAEVMRDEAPERPTGRVVVLDLDDPRLLRAIGRAIGSGSYADQDQRVIDDALAEVGIPVIHDSNDGQQQVAAGGGWDRWERRVYVTDWEQQ